MPRNIITKAINYYEEHGFIDLLKRINRPLRRIKRFIFVKNSFYVFYRFTKCCEKPLKYDDVEFKEIDASMARTVAKHLEGHYTENDVYYRMKSGEIAIAGFGKNIYGDSGDILFLCWISDHDDILNKFIKKNNIKNGYCIKRLFVPEKYRRRKIAFRAHASINYIAREHGIRILWSFIDKNNKANYNLHTSRLKNTTKIFGEIIIVTFMGIQFIKIHNRENPDAIMSFIDGK